MDMAKRPRCNCGKRLRRFYSRRGTNGKEHHPEGWGCPECQTFNFDKREMS